MEKKEIDFSYTECYKQYDKLGETIYQNICNGEKTTVPWGLGGWTLSIFLLLLILSLIFAIILMIRMAFDI